MRTVGHHAVVIGASMAGLLTARVLTEAYERVTVVERDVLPVRGEHRRGVPQAHHLHVLLASGFAALETLFDGFAKEMMMAGGLRPTRPDHKPAAAGGPRPGAGACPAYGPGAGWL